MLNRYNHNLFSRKIFNVSNTRFNLIVLTLAAMLYPTASYSLGSRIENIDLFFEFAIRLQYEKESDFNKVQAFRRPPPIDKLRDDYINLRPIAGFRSKWLQGGLKCNDLEMITYNQWIIKNNRINSIINNNLNAEIPSDLWVSADWNSPFFIRLNIGTDLLGRSVRNADIYIAAMYHVFDIQKLINNGSLNKETAEKLVKVKGVQFDSIYYDQLKDKYFRIKKIIKCQGFSIYHLEIN